MVSKGQKLSVRRECVLLTLVRSNLFHVPKGARAENLRFMEIIDKQFLETPWYGLRQMARYMKREGHACGRHRVRRLMRLMRLVPIHCPAVHGYMHERVSRTQHPSPGNTCLHV
jgi:putative transposase